MAVDTWTVEVRDKVGLGGAAAGCAWRWQMLLLLRAIAVGEQHQGWVRIAQHGGEEEEEEEEEREEGYRG